MDMYRFIESNDNEGETWCFYFYASDDLIIKLNAIIEDWDCYSIEDVKVTPEDIKIANYLDCNCSYMKAHQFCGTLNQTISHVDLEEDDSFYKGGIKQFCTMQID